MNRHSILSVFFIVFFIFFSCISVNASEKAADRPDVIIKISRLHQAIDVIDNMAAVDIDQPTSAPSFFLRSVLFGTDWIDPNRSIVIGINFENMNSDAKPVMAALIPYIRQNEDFHISYGAVSKIDYYLVSLPPGEGGVISAQMAHDLARASLKKQDGLLSMEIAASQLLNKADRQIQKMLLELDAKMADQTTLLKDPTNDFTSEDINKLLNGLIKAAKQVETFSMGMDISASELIIFSDALALKKTDLSKLFSRNAASKTSRMGKYTPKHHINFKSTRYDVKGMITFFNEIFGEFYKKIGIDLTDIGSMASHFTGEVAGGVSFNDTGMDIEMIAVLNDSEKTGAEFLASVYLPWMMDYGKKMANFYNQQAHGKLIKNIFSKTPESNLYGNKVFGINGKIPVIMSDPAAADKIKFHLRTTVVNNLLLTASTDERLKKLIKIALTLEKQPYDGPVMKMDLDIGAYLDAVRKMIPETDSGMNMNLSNLGSLIYTFDIEKGKLRNKYVIQIDDIRSLVSAFKQASAASMAAENENIYGADQSFLKKGQKPKSKKLKPKKKDPSKFWLDKGLLYATYGNDKEAIKFYKKALQIAPNNPRTLFNMGLSYTSLENYDKAITALNQALSLAPDNGDYHYGLGWVYLLKGESGKAMEYIRTAADLGNPDARKYLLKYK